MSPGFVVDLNRCTGCQACVVACWMENRERQTTNWRQVHTYNAFRHPGLPCFHLSLACHHCEHPACLVQCPAKAYTRDATTGAVIIHADRCMGCRYCTWACPHDAPKFSTRTGTIEKCTFCEERLKDGLEPACVARCPVEALSLDPARLQVSGPQVPGFPASDLEPGIHFVPLRRDSAPEVTAPASLMQRFLEQVIAIPAPKITLRGEWTLVAFTTVVSILVAWYAASVLGGPVVHSWLFLVSGICAMALSASHLGHPGRAWRAALNVRSSWLSREIVLISMFLGLAGMQWVVLSQHRSLGILTAVTGFLALFTVDRIYRVALQKGPWNLHSAHVCLNGLYLMGWLLRSWPLVMVTGALKLLLYLHRKLHARRGVRSGARSQARSRARSMLSLVRLALGFGVPAIAQAFNPGIAILSVVGGDLVDRCEYYDELEVTTPQGHMNTALKQRLGEC